MLSLGGLGVFEKPPTASLWKHLSSYSNPTTRVPFHTGLLELYDDSSTTSDMTIKLINCTVNLQCHHNGTLPLFCGPSSGPPAVTRSAKSG